MIPLFSASSGFKNTEKKLKTQKPFHYHLREWQVSAPVKIAYCPCAFPLEFPKNKTTLFSSAGYVLTAQHCKISMFGP